MEGKGLRSLNNEEKRFYCLFLFNTTFLYLFCFLYFLACSMLSLLIGFILIFSYDVSSSQIAICVSGQISRWLPVHLLSGVIQANSDHFFHLFINLQYHLNDDMSSVFTTNSALSFESTPVSKMKSIDLLNYIHSLYSTKNSQVVSMEFVPPRSLLDWKKSFALSSSLLNSTSYSKGGSLPNLDRISLYVKKQHAILNLYSHQIRCYDQIKSYEKNGVKIDYVINTREDIFYFKPINLAKLLPNHQQLMIRDEILLRSEEVGNSRPFSFLRNSLRHSFCDLVVKNCLKWNGTNMRWQLFSHDHSSAILENRLKYYRYLYKINTTFHNPEIFELNQYKYFQLNICEYPIDDIPATAVRYVGGSRDVTPSSSNGECFIAQEIGDRCVPAKFQKLVKDNNCNLFINSTATSISSLKNDMSSESKNHLDKKYPKNRKKTG
jgi:hypothetical protein